MQAVCSRCSTPNPLDNRICSYCGTSLPVVGQMDESRAPSTASEPRPQRSRSPAKKWLISGAVFIGVALLGLVVSLILTPFAPAMQDIATPAAVTQAVAAHSSATPQPPPATKLPDAPALAVPSEPSDTPAIPAPSESTVTPETASTSGSGDGPKVGSGPTSTPMHQPTAASPSEPAGSAEPETASPQPTATPTPVVTDTPEPTDMPEPTDIPKPTATPEPTREPEPEPLQAKEPQRPPRNAHRDTRLARIGEQVQAGAWLFTVTGVQWRSTLHWHEWSREADGVWAVLLLDIQNQSSRPTSFQMSQWELYGAGSGSFDESSTLYASWQFGGRETAYTELNPGQRAQIVMAFDVAEQGKGLVLYSDRLGRAVVYVGDAQPPQDQ